MDRWGKRDRPGRKMYREGRKERWREIARGRETDGGRRTWGRQTGGVGEGGAGTQPQNANNGSIEHGFQDTVVLEM